MQNQVFERLRSRKQEILDTKAIKLTIVQAVVEAAKAKVLSRSEEGRRHKHRAK